MRANLLGLLLDPRNARDVVDPIECRASPYLFPRYELLPLLNRADTHAVCRRLAFGRRCVNRRPALWAERLHTLSATLGGGLQIDLRFAGAKPETLLL